VPPPGNAWTVPVEPSAVCEPLLVAAGCNATAGSAATRIEPNVAAAGADAETAGTFGFPIWTVPVEPRACCGPEPSAWTVPVELPAVCEPLADRCGRTLARGLACARTEPARARV